MRGVVVSDIHADAITDGVDRYPEIRAALMQAAQYAVDTHCDFFACLGDVTDPGPRSYRAVAMLIECYRVLRERGILFMGINGNHDLVDDELGSSTLDPLRAAGATVAANPHRVPLHGIEVLLLPYPRFRSNLGEYREQVEDALRAGPPVQLVLGHLCHPKAERGSESRDFARGRDVDWPMDLLAGYAPHSLCIGGHYHQGQAIPGEGGAPTLHVVGSMARLRHDEEAFQPAFLSVRLDAATGDLKACR